jgi:hypothetical protein
MKIHVRILATVLLALSLLMIVGRLLAQSSGGGNTLRWSVTGGGGVSTGDVYVLRGSIGQPDAGDALNGGGYTLVGGFWGSPVPLSGGIVVPDGGAPIRNYFVVRNVPLSWSAVSWAAGYWVEVSKNQNFAGTVYKNDTLDASTLSVTTTILTDNGLYYWHVRAKRPDGSWGAWSITDSFQVNAP